MARGINQVSNLSQLFVDVLDQVGGDTARAEKILGQYLNDPKVFNKLVEQGVVKTAVPQVSGVESLFKSALTPEGLATGAAAVGIPAAVAAAAPAIASAAGGGGGGLGGALLGALGFGSNLAANFLGEKFAQGTGQPGALGPSAYPVGDPSSSSRYLSDPSTLLAQTQYYQNEVFRARALNALANRFGLPDVAVEPMDPETFAKFQSALRQQEAESMSARRMREIATEKQYDYLARGLEAQAGVERQKQQSLGDIQRQRVASSYDAASSMLNSAIQNIMAREKYENSTSLAELAQAV